jgi:polar amino acid transport system permease protein
MNYQLNFAAVWRDFDTLLAGLGLGLELALVSIAIGCVIGLMMAFACCRSTAHCGCWLRCM